MLPPKKNPSRDPAPPARGGCRRTGTRTCRGTDGRGHLSDARSRYSYNPLVRVARSTPGSTTSSAVLRRRHREHPRQCRTKRQPRARVRCVTRGSATAHPSRQGATGGGPGWRREDDPRGGWAERTRGGAKAGQRPPRCPPRPGVAPPPTHAMSHAYSTNGGGVAVRSRNAPYDCSCATRRRAPTCTEAAERQESPTGKAAGSKVPGKWPSMCTACAAQAPSRPTSPRNQPACGAVADRETLRGWLRVQEGAHAARLPFR